MGWGSRQNATTSSCYTAFYATLFIPLRPLLLPLLFIFIIIIIYSSDAAFWVLFWSPLYIFREFGCARLHMEIPLVFFVNLKMMSSRSLVSILMQKCQSSIVFVLFSFQVGISFGIYRQILRIRLFFAHQTHSRAVYFWKNWNFYVFFKGDYLRLIVSYKSPQIPRDFLIPN